MVTVVRSFLLASLIASAPALAAPPDQPRRYSVEELKQDFGLMRAALEELHPSLTWYTPEVQLTRAFDAAIGAIDRPMNEREFRDLAQPVLTLIRCGHTFLSTSPAFDAWTDSLPPSFLPLQLWVEGQRLYVLADKSGAPSLQPGDELLEINGLAVSQILTRARAMIQGDGYIETFRDEILNIGELKRFVAYTLNFRSPFAVTVARPDGQRLKKVITRKPDAPPAPAPATTAAVPAAPSRPARTFMVKDNATAVLTIKGFNHPDAAAYHRDVFKEIADKGVRHLIIDLRENSGGNGDDAEDLMTYLMDRPFRYFSDQWAKVRHPERPSFVKHLEPRTAKLLLDNNKYQRSQAGRHYFANTSGATKQPAQRYRYRGAVYLLVSGRTFSSASLFAASLKAQRTIAVIGQETGGGQAGCSGGIQQHLTLPHTGMRLNIPVFRIQSGNPAANQGRGLMPDHPVHYRWQDRLAGKDLEMDKALDLIARTGS